MHDWISDGDYIRDGGQPAVARCRDVATAERIVHAQKAEAEVARLNRWMTQIHASLAERAETELELWAMTALERAMRGEAAG